VLLKLGTCLLAYFLFYICFVFLAVLLKLGTYLLACLPPCPVAAHASQGLG
jgi:hypothetical protein